MARGGRKKSHGEFWEESLDFFVENGRLLREIRPECTDEYNVRSILKLLCIKYWAGIFSPIVHGQLRKLGYRIAYVDSMAGSGVTTTKKSDPLSGSCPSVMLSAAKHNCPFDLVIANEINPQKADVLEERIRQKVQTSEELRVFKKNILDASNDIINIIHERRTISYMVIDPEGFKGMNWSALKPLLSCKGDAMITWFEHEALRLRGAALSQKEFPQAKADRQKLDDLFGPETWINATTGPELTAIFINRVLRECGKAAFEKVHIRGPDGKYIVMILFVGNFDNCHKLVKDWRINIENRINSDHGSDISSLLDVKAGRLATLSDPRWSK